MGMIVGRDDRRRRVCAVVLAGLLAGTVSVATPGAAANAAAPSVADAGASSLVEIRSTPAADLGLSDLAGVTFDAQSGRLVLADAGVDAVVSVDRAGGSATGTALAGDPNAATLSVDPSADRVTAVDSNRMAAAGTGGGATLTVPLPELVAAEFDQVDGTWVGLTESGNELTIVDRSPAAAGARSTTIDVSAVGSTPLIAVAPNPDDGLIYVLGDVLYAVDEQGAVQRSIPLTDTGLSAPSDMVFAPSSDQTDAPATQSLFVVDNGAQGGSRLVELGLDLAAPMALAAGAFEATLVNTIDMSQLNPPAPDTSGIVYLPAQDRLMVSDSEVEEMSIYQGVNLYKVTRTGSLTDSGTTVSFSQEPTGLGFQASTNTLLVSDDDADRIYKVVPGNDGRHGTGDDSITSVPTSFTGNNDAEDVTYHPDSGHLFVVDGVNKEVYRYQLNGTFVSQFDVGAYGAGDPEGIAFDAATGTFFVLDDASTTIYQVDIDGNLVNTIGIGAAGALKAAGIAVAPASNGSGNRNLYIVDRGIDNDGNPNENDGAIYEMSIPGGGPVNQAPVVNAGVDQLVTAPDTAALVGTASDDGLPDPPATLTTTWSQISGPGTVTFGDASSLSTSASFSAGGVYVLRLTASDSLSSSTDEIEITFVDPNAPSQLNVAIAASTDDAEENNAGGNVNRNSADLELVDDGTVNQTVGLRFVGVNIPDNAVISNAYVQFTVDEVKTAATSLTVRGELSNNAVTYSSPVFNVTSRPDTTASVAWSPPAWSVVGVAGAAQRTPNLSGIVQEIIDQSGWLTGNAVAFTIAGTGVRTARAFDFGSGAAVLHIEYTIGGSPTNQAPVVNAGVDQSVTLPSSAALAGSATDDGLPAPPATVTTTWSQVSGPGTTTFGDASALSTSASFSEAGVYVLRLTASDSALSASDDVQVTVGAAPPGNQAPVVNAGVDQSVTLPTPAALAGSATDDGLPAPPATVTTTWSQVSGPGTTTFGDASSLSTSAAFSVAGVYVLRLTASDSVLSSTDDIQITVNPAAPGNQAPVVNAGVDQSVTLPASAALVGSATDDGLPAPPATVTTTWSQVSGPGTTTFGDASSLSTSAAFSVAGVYVLRLTASDSVLSSTDDIQITVSAPGGSSTLDVSISAVSDDAEENNPNGVVDLTSSDLELAVDKTLVQTVGLRFVGMAIPVGAVITNAYVQFTVDEAKSAAVSLTVRGELSPNPPTYTTATANVTSRPDTLASVAWSPPAWTPVGAAGVAQRTPNLSGIVQEIIGQGGWASGNAIAVTIAGTGTRTARAFNFGGAPVLHIEYSGGGGGGPTNQAPVVNAGVDQSVTLPASAALVGSASDDGLPAPPATVTVTWSQVSGPGTTTFGDASSLSTSASFSVAGVYVLRLTGSDSLLSSTDDIQVTVSEPGTNQAPVVNAGVDQSVTLPASAALVGSASDDGLPAPPATVTVTWSQVSGPGTTTFGNASSLSTSASFSAAGVYVLRLTASDSALSSTDDIQVTVGAAPTNQAPVVNAGVDQSVTLPASAALVGSASDDGLPAPPATVTVTWSQVSGPGTTTFGNASSLSTSASFSAAGVYVLRLTGSDSLLSSTDDIQITVSAPGGSSTLDVSISAVSDDAEENNPNGAVDLTSSDLELAVDKTLVQTVGLRFVGMAIPVGAVITNAYVQFTVDEAKATAPAASLTVRGELSPNPPTYTTATANVTARPDTLATVAWSPPAWTAVGAAGVAQRTPNLSGIVQEIVGQAGWASGNAIAVTIAGTGTRTARAFNFGGAPVLHIEYTIP